MSIIFYAQQQILLLQADHHTFDAQAVKPAKWGVLDK